VDGVEVCVENRVVEGEGAREALRLSGQSFLGVLEEEEADAAVLEDCNLVVAPDVPTLEEAPVDGLRLLEVGVCSWEEEVDNALC
jgi:hypothetical protein